MVHLMVILDLKDSKFKLYIRPLLFLPETGNLWKGLWEEILSNHFSFAIKLFAFT